MQFGQQGRVEDDERRVAEFGARRQTGLQANEARRNTGPPPTRPGGAVLILDTPKSNKMYANYIDRFVMGTAFDEGVLILDTPKSDKMYANYIDRFLMTAAFDEGVGEAELVQ